MDIRKFTEKATGTFVPIVENGLALQAFVPNNLPRSITLSNKIIKQIESASKQLGRLFGAGDIINPLLPLFLRREAIASNKMEGTITTARDLYTFESEIGLYKNKSDQPERAEVFNYIVAMKLGVNTMGDRPISLNLLNALHKTLLDGVRGQYKSPGEIRKRQNAISTKNVIDSDAKYIPPPPTDVLPCIGDLEEYINENSDTPDLVRAALVHYQFEAIHPYMDGNGRLGRLLIPLLLQSWHMIPKGSPRLYLSPFFEQNDDEYRQRLLMVSQNGEWDEWIDFFLRAIMSESEKMWDKAHELTKLRDDYYGRVADGPGKLQQVIRALFERPVLKIKDVSKIAEVSSQQARNYAKNLMECKILSTDDRAWGRHYYADDILRIFFGE